jgi:hypothetical protein
VVDTHTHTATHDMPPQTRAHTHTHARKGDADWYCQAELNNRVPAQAAASTLRRLLSKGARQQRLCMCYAKPRHGAMLRATL